MKVLFLSNEGLRVVRALVDKAGNEKPADGETDLVLDELRSSLYRFSAEPNDSGESLGLASLQRIRAHYGKLVAHAKDVNASAAWPVDRGWSRNLLDRIKQMFADSLLAEGAKDVELRFIESELERLHSIDGRIATDTEKVKKIDDALSLSEARVKELEEKNRSNVASFDAMAEARDNDAKLIDSLRKEVVELREHKMSLAEDVGRVGMAVAKHHATIAGDNMVDTAVCLIGKSAELSSLLARIDWKIAQQFPLISSRSRPDEIAACTEVLFEELTTWRLFRDRIAATLRKAGFREITSATIETCIEQVVSRMVELEILHGSGSPCTDPAANVAPLLQRIDKKLLDRFPKLSDRPTYAHIVTTVEYLLDDLASRRRGNNPAEIATKLRAQASAHKVIAKDLRKQVTHYQEEADAQRREVAMARAQLAAVVALVKPADGESVIEALARLVRWQSSVSPDETVPTTG